MIEQAQGRPACSSAPRHKRGTSKPREAAWIGIGCAMHTPVAAGTQCRSSKTMGIELVGTCPQSHIARLYICFPSQDHANSQAAGASPASL